MYGLLGKITNIKTKAGSNLNFDITFEPVAVLPDRTAVPKGLKGKKLKLERRVSHRQELGGIGDMIVIGSGEASKWLSPLAVEPAIARGRAPSRITIRLRWWPDKKPPDYSVSVPGASLSGKFKKGPDDEWTAELRTERFLPRSLAAPFDVRVKCGELEAWCAVLPHDKPVSRRICAAPAPFHRLENEWYSADVTPDRYAGGIVSLVERGRGVEHFPAVEGLIQHPLEQAGLCARCRVDFMFTNEGAKVAHTGSYISAGDLRAVFEGEIEPASGLRSITEFTLTKSFPLLVVDRRYAIPKKKKEGGPGPAKDAARQKPPPQPVDDLYSLSHCLTALWPAAEEARVLWVDKEALNSTRPAMPWYMLSGPDWKLRKGWVLAENGERTRGILFLSAPDPPDRLVVRRMGNYDRFILEEEPLPLGPDEGAGRAAAVAAGETWGASEKGAWIGVRTPLAGGGVRCAFIARTEGLDGSAEVLARVGRRKGTAPLERLSLPGIGPAAAALIDIPGGTMSSRFEAEVDGIPSRR